MLFAQPQIVLDNPIGIQEQNFSLIETDIEQILDKHKFGIDSIGDKPFNLDISALAANWPVQGLTYFFTLIDKVKLLLKLVIDVVEFLFIEEDLIDLLLEELDFGVAVVLVAPF